ncbi:Hypothetical protein NTJ_15974 [Nesidiocoris tenuis]|uniref:Reverse transcriptase domain-containing protein n=1 Tax=Nesidiocoris tenuis TaxID=355587 RepID=A0ABN7BI40_9HEMI|nr:Hypothetical protein NTJ_15974 [Nesidiocoris tenuis]
MSFPIDDVLFWISSLRHVPQGDLLSRRGPDWETSSLGGLHQGDVLPRRCSLWETSSLLDALFGRCLLGDVLSGRRPERRCSFWDMS